MKHMDSLDITDGGESPQSKRKSYSKSDKKEEELADFRSSSNGVQNVNNSNNLSGYSTLPLKGSENRRPINGVRTSSLGSGIHRVTEGEERYQSLPTLPARSRSKEEIELDLEQADNKLNLANLQQVTSV